MNQYSTTPTDMYRLSLPFVIHTFSPLSVNVGHMTKIYLYDHSTKTISLVMIYVMVYLELYIGENLDKLVPPLVEGRHL